MIESRTSRTSPARLLLPPGGGRRWTPLATWAGLLGLAGIAAVWLIATSVGDADRHVVLLMATCVTAVSLIGSAILVHRIVALADDLRHAEQASDILEQVVDAFPHGVSIKDAALRYLWTNRVHGERTGFDFARLRGRRPDECIVDPILAATAMAHDRRALESGRTEGPIEQRLVLPDGSINYSYVTKIPVQLNGGVTHVVTVGADVTELHRARQEAVEARRLLEAIMDAAPVTIQVKDSDLTIRWANRAYRQHIKLHAGVDDPVGKEFAGAAANPAIAAATIEADREVLRTGHQLVQIQQQFPATETAPECHLLVTKTPIRDAEGRPIQVLTIGTDITAVKAAQAEAHIAHRLIEGIIRHAPAMIHVKDRELRYRWVNEYFAQSVGVEPAALIGQTAWGSRANAEIVAMSEGWDRHVLETGIIGRYFADFVPPDRPDERQHFLVTKAPVLDESGTPSHVVSFNIDITELRRAEADVAAANLLLKQIIDNVPIWIHAKDRERRFTLVNRTYCEQMGLREGDILGRRADEVFDDPDAVRETELRDRLVLSTGETQGPYESTQFAAHGDIVHLLVSKLPLREPDGAVARIVTVAVDITARRLAEEALRELNQELERRVDDRTADLAKANDLLGKVVLGAPIPIVTYGRDGRVTGWNPAAERVTGFAAAEVIGRFPPTQDDAGRLQFADMARRIAHGESYTGIEARRARKDGMPLDLLISGAPLTNPDGAIVGAIGIWLDVTEQRAVERQLRQAQKMEAVGQLTGGIAHDFNNLLSVVIGNLELAAEARDTAEAKSLADNALEAALKSAELTRRLLAFSRQKMQAASRAQPAGVIAGMRDMLARSLGPRIAIVLDSGADPWSIMVDVPQLESCIVNLGVNARDAMPDGGCLTIATRNVTFDADDSTRPTGLSPGDFVQIAVTDTGTGMSPEVLARAFEPFFTTKEVGKGTGLGLSMVYAFAGQSRGSTLIQSEPGQGTTVTILLPRAPAETVAATPGPRAERRPSAGGERILVVEDDAWLADTVVLQLRLLGYRPTRVADAAAAIEALRGPEPFDLLFTDIMMPGSMDGRGLAEAAMRLRPGLPCLLTTGHEQNKAPTAATSHLRVLSKPYRRDDLAQALRETLEADAA